MTGHVQMDTAGRGHWDCTTRGHWEKGISPHEDTGKRGFHHTGTLGEWNIHNMGTPQRGRCTAHSTYLLQHNNIPQPPPCPSASPPQIYTTKELQKRGNPPRTHGAPPSTPGRRSGGPRWGRRGTGHWGRLAARRATGCRR